MSSKRLPRKFYTRPTLTVAKDLLGKYLVRKIGKRRLVGKIVETEAYIGPEDRASHAYLPRKNSKPISREEFETFFRELKVDIEELYRNFLRGGGKVTERNKAEYLEGGHIYIYLCYGMYWQLNITTEKAGKPECVLIRALEPIAGPKNLKSQKSNLKTKTQNLKLLRKLASGPGKLCRWMKFNKSFYSEDLTKSKRIWLEDRGEKIKKSQIVAAKRIGIDYAGLWAEKPWRFYIKDNPFVSKK